MWHRPDLRSHPTLIGRQYLLEAPGESLRVAVEPTVVAGEDHGFFPQPLGERHGGAVRELPLRPLAHGHRDRRRPEPGDVRRVVAERQPHVPEKEIEVPLHPGHRLGHLGGGAGGRLRRVLVKAGRGEELPHRRAHAFGEVGVVDLPREPGVLVGVVEQPGQRRLVGDHRPHLLRVPGDQLEPDQGAAAAAEHVRRFGAERREQPVRVVGEGPDGRVPGVAVNRAAGQPPRVVGDHRVPVG
jgi:hypothetical protein